jgi:hypothetical protein
MYYEPLQVADCQTSAQMTAVYTASRKRLLLAGQRVPRSLLLLPPPFRPLIDEPPHARTILTLKDELVEPLSAQAIMAAVAVAHQITVGEIKGPRRWLRFVHARQHAVALMMKHRPDLSLPLIGKLMNRNHSTILNSKRQWPKIAGKFVRHARSVQEAIGLDTPGCG